MDSGSERDAVIEHLARVVLRLEGSLNARLVPLEGTRIVYAIRGARDSGGVAGIPGGVAGSDDIRQAAGACSFGADEIGAGMILTAMKFDSGIRAVATLRYSPALTSLLDQMLLDICSFDRIREPPGLSSMYWGIASCCRDGVPDVIYDTGAPGREGLVRLFGEKPEDIVNNIIILSNRIMSVEL